MRKTEIKEMNLPQLIVGLDSQNDDSNYIHINDVKENVDYYCPCCKGLIKPRAYKKDEKYKMQPHFYHISGGCTEETYIHYICKNFLFKTGSKFVVESIEYEVKDVVTEKGYSTKFGVYIPDITVVTTFDKIFYFEIRNTNKKTTDYIPKWDELGNDVVEVDVRYFVNQKFKNDIPIFKPIYSNGECFIREYVRKGYEQIEQRKLEWKRQDKLNYKIKWERLDWFWKKLQEYKLLELSEEKVVESFSNLDFKDMEFGIKVIKSHKFETLLNKCIEINNSEFNRQIENLGIEITHESTMIHYITYPKTEHCKVQYFPSYEYRKKMTVCTYSCLQNILEIQEQEINKTNIEIEEKLNELNNNLNNLGITDVTYKDTAWKYYDQKYNYFTNKLENVINFRLFYNYEECYKKVLNDFKTYVNKHSGWFFDYCFDISVHNSFIYLNCILKFNGRNDCKFNLRIDKTITFGNVVETIKKHFEYYMPRMVRLDGYKKTNWWTGKIYCEKDRLMVVKENN